MGRLPVYIYDDVKWLPYENTNISLATFGFIGRYRSLGFVFNEMMEVNSSEFERRMQQVRRVRQYYTYQGVIQQIDAFIRDPLGPSGGYLRCQRVPGKDH